MNLMGAMCIPRSCKHYWGISQPDPENEGSQRHACAAFPKGIPPEIAFGDNLHEKIYPGQEGDFVYEKGEIEDHIFEGEEEF